MISEIIKNIRKSENLTAKQLSLKLNVSASLIYEWEHGRSNPSLDDIVKIANIFNVSTDYLLGLEDDFGIKTKNNVVKKILSEEITKEEIEMIKKIRLMDTYSQTYIKAQIDALSATAKNKQKEKFQL